MNRSKDGVSIQLTGPMGSTWDGWCERAKGESLLAEIAEHENEIDALNDERDELLAPYRATLAIKSYQKELAHYQEMLPKHQREYAAWMRRKEEYHRNLEKSETVLVTSMEGDENQLTEQDILAHVGDYGCRTGRNESWRFFITGERAKKTKRLLVYCERPRSIVFPEPSPWLPSKPECPFTAYEFGMEAFA